MIGSGGVSFYLSFHSYKWRRAEQGHYITVSRRGQDALTCQLLCPWFSRSQAEFASVASLLSLRLGQSALCCLGSLCSTHRESTGKQERFSKCCSLVPSVSSAYGSSWQQRRKSSRRSLCMVLCRILMSSCLHSSVGPGHQGTVARGWLLVVYLLGAQPLTAAGIATLAEV